MSNEQVDVNTDLPPRHVFPSNVHMATKGQKSGGGSLQNKKIVVVAGLIILVIALTITGYVGGKKYGFGLLSGAITFVLSIVLAVFLYHKLVRDKLNESFEADPNNKVLKLFRIRLNDSEQEKTKQGVDIMSYTSGEIFVTLRMEIGNSSLNAEEITRGFLESMFKAAHQLNLGVKNYNTLAQWRKSDVYYNHLRRLSKVRDPKLRATLTSIDAVQSKTFDEGQVNAIHFVFYTRRQNQKSLEALVGFVNEWMREDIHSSSVRTMKWLNNEETVTDLCDFLTIGMLDVTSNMNKNSIKYDTRSIVRVYSAERFDAEEDVDTKTGAIVLRKGKVRK